MKKIILIKYAELSTKKGNKNYFIKLLKHNILKKLDEYEIELKYDFSRMKIYTNENNIDGIVNILKKIFGIHEIVIAYESDELEIDKIFENSLELIRKKEFKTFKVEAKRSTKSYPIDSMTISRKVGAYILKNIKDIDVDVKNPEVLLNIEIRDKLFIYYERIKGLNGYPVGSLGKGLVMISGGIDSPVSAFLSLKRGIKVDYVYFDSPPHTSMQARKKVIDLVTKVSEYGVSPRIYIVKFTKMQEEILKNCNREYLITIMRRMMYRVSELICNNNKYLAVINGENVGQVASQTLTSMGVINEVVKIPVLRPLCMYDKLEIINIAKKIDTYEISILPYEDCCTIFVPDHPVINPLSKIALKEENKFDYNTILDEIMNNIEIIDLKKVEKNEYL